MGQPPAGRRLKTVPCCTPAADVTWAGSRKSARSILCPVAGFLLLQLRWQLGACRPGHRLLLKSLHEPASRHGFGPPKHAACCGCNLIQQLVIRGLSAQSRERAHGLPSCAVYCKPGQRTSGRLAAESWRLLLKRHEPTATRGGWETALGEGSLSAPRSPRTARALE